MHIITFTIKSIKYNSKFFLMDKLASCIYNCLNDFLWIVILLQQNMYCLALYCRQRHSTFECLIIFNRFVSLSIKNLLFCLTLNDSTKNWIIELVEKLLAIIGNQLIARLVLCQPLADCLLKVFVRQNFETIIYISFCLSVCSLRLLCQCSLFMCLKHQLVSPLTPATPLGFVWLDIDI